jgi:hypothetical protein
VTPTGGGGESPHPQGRQLPMVARVEWDGTEGSTMTRKRIPLALSRPEPDETDEEFVERFATEVFDAIQAAREQPDDHGRA